MYTLLDSKAYKFVTALPGGLHVDPTPHQWRCRSEYPCPLSSPLPGPRGSELEQVHDTAASDVRRSEYESRQVLDSVDDMQPSGMPTCPAIQTIHKCTITGSKMHRCVVINSSNQPCMDLVGQGELIQRKPFWFYFKCQSLPKKNLARLIDVSECGFI